MHVGVRFWCLPCAMAVTYPWTVPGNRLEPRDHNRPVERGARIRSGDLEVAGTLAVPAGARGVVVFAHGSGSSRFSPRNQFVADHLRGRGLGTLLMDLLTEEEERIDARTGTLRFDVRLLTR